MQYCFIYYWQLGRSQAVKVVPGVKGDMVWEDEDTQVKVTEFELPIITSGDILEQRQTNLYVPNYR